MLLKLIQLCLFARDPSAALILERVFKISLVIFQSSVKGIPATPKEITGEQVIDILGALSDLNVSLNVERVFNLLEVSRGLKF